MWVVEHLAISGDIVDYHIWGRGCYWYLVGSSQRNCPSMNAQDNALEQNIIPFKFQQC